MKALLLIFLLSTSFAEKKRVWIDYDLSFGKFGKEVDDGLALYHAIASQDQFEIVGLSTVFGNTRDMKHQREMSKKILRKLGAEHIPLYDGASGRRDFGKKLPAMKGIINALEQGPLTIIAIGRLTNVASVLFLRPDLQSNLQELIVNAGNSHEYDVTFGPKQVIFPDTNFDGDVEAFDFLKMKKVPMVMIPVESMTHIPFLEDDVIKMEKIGGFPKWFAKRTRWWQWGWKHFTGIKGFIPWDVYTVAYLTHRDDFHCEEKIPWDIKVKKNTAHHLLNVRNFRRKKEFLVTSYELSSKALATYCHHINEKLIENLLRSWKARPF